MQSRTWGVTPHPHPHMGTAVTQGWGGCWGQQGRNGAFQVFAVKKEREKKAKSSKTEQLSKEQPGWFHSQPHCVMHGLGDSFPHNTSLSRTLELTVPGINPNQSHDPMDAPGAGSSTGPSTTRTWVWMDPAMMPSMDQTGSSLRLMTSPSCPEKNTGVSWKSWFWNTNIHFSRCHSLSRGMNPFSRQVEPLFREFYPHPTTKAPWNCSSCCNSHHSPLISMDAR